MIIIKMPNPTTLIIFITVLLIILTPSLQQSNIIVCVLIPFNYITPCSSTCVTCSASGSRDQCGSCPSYLTLSESSQNCETPTGTTYYIDNYFQQTEIYNTTDL